MCSVLRNDHCWLETLWALNSVVVMSFAVQEKHMSVRIGSFLLFTSDVDKICTYKKYFQSYMILHEILSHSVFFF